MDSERRLPSVGSSDAHLAGQTAAPGHGAGVANDDAAGVAKRQNDAVDLAMSLPATTAQRALQPCRGLSHAAATARAYIGLDVCGGAQPDERRAALGGVPVADHEGNFAAGRSVTGTRRPVALLLRGL